MRSAKVLRRFGPTLRRKSTRIALKPEDRDEYQAHKKDLQAQKSGAGGSQSKEKPPPPSDKEVRIGIVPGATR